jgi:hypothetical protein
MANMKRKIKTKKKLTMSSYVMIVGIITFGIMAGLLFQHSSISEVNNEIRSLQKDLDDVVQVNDSKEGQLVTNMDLAAIEFQARAYGMKEPVQEQYRRETIVESNQAMKDSNSTGKKNWFDIIFN